MTSLWSGLLALLLALVFTVFAGAIVALFTTSEDVRAIANAHVFWASLIPLVGFAAFQLDGIFVGATGSVEMRNALIGASVVYFPLSAVLMSAFGNHGVWAAIWVWLLLRAGLLALRYPRIRARAAAGRPADRAG